jgi:carboxyl-terminal processing protease
MRSRAIPSAAVVVLLSAIAGGLFGSRVMARADRVEERLRQYALALATIEREYVEPVETAPLVYGSIDGMLRTLDPHSSFLDPREFAQMRERQEGHYYGIGISIVAIDGDVTVSSLFEGSPAYRAGIRRGDVIARVGKEDAKGWSTDEVVRRVKGPKGTPVDISIRRRGLDELIDLTVVRDEIHITTIRAAFLVAPGTGYVRLQDFSDTSNDELTAALGRLKTAGMQRLVLDLRDNPGGPLDQAIAVANQFLRRGQMIVSTRGRVPRSDEDYPATEEGRYTDIPLVVLTSRRSASASEIVAGAVQDHDRGYIVGETTFGKALVQSVYPIANNAALALTTAHYYTPIGRLIQRPWDGSFDEYYTYDARDQANDRQRPASELRHTAGGRKVYGGGGIQPDHFIPGPLEGFNPSAFSRMLMSRGAFINFAERFTKDGDARPLAKSAARHKVSPGWQITDALIAEFKEFVGGQRVKIDEAAFTADRAFIAAMIHYEVDYDLFGVSEARKTLTLVDPQVKAALSDFEEARKLLEMYKK